MSRFIQEGRGTPKPDKKDKPRVLPKTGTYTVKDFEKIKTITTPNSGRF